MHYFCFRIESMHVGMSNVVVTYHNYDYQYHIPHTEHDKTEAASTQYRHIDVAKLHITHILYFAEWGG